MLSFNGIRNACTRCNYTTSLSLTRSLAPRGSIATTRTLTNIPRYQPTPPTSRIAKRNFSSSSCIQQENADVNTRHAVEDIEKVVRDAKQRFRDTLPKDYLNEQEYELYVRLYGPPLRETVPDDVGIPMHADMGVAIPSSATEGTVLRELEDGEFEELSYERSPEAVEHEAEALEAQIAELASQDVIEKAPGYVDVIARNQREHDALQKLLLDFEAAQKKEVEESTSELEEDTVQEESASSWPPEEEFDFNDRELGEVKRFHRYTLDGRFHGSPVEISLPKDELLMPVRDILDRTHHTHVRKAAEEAFGGRGLPLSPATPEGLKTGHMDGVGLPPDQRHMTEIEADAFLAGYIPPAYASVMAILREVRKRVGSEWLQSKLKQGTDGGLSVLDAGTGGAGLVAWEQVLRAEWDLLKEKGEVKGSEPPGKKTVVVGSDRLRHRVKGFLDNTTFLPRLPDYLHSGEMQGERLEGGDKPLPRKSYDIIIASHLFLKEKQDHYRQAVLNNLWSLLNKDGGVLIVMEKAHPRGFEAVAHVRDTVLNHFLQPQSGESSLEPDERNPAYQRELEPGHIIAPCTNHGACPMYKVQGKSRGRKDFCHFSQRFVRPAFYSKVLGSSADNRGEVDFSYVVFQRGVAKKDQISGKEATDRAFKGFEVSDEQPDMQTLPRLILPALKRKGHVTLDLCTAEGKIERWTVPKSFSKLAYHDARKGRWGDLWPLGAKTRVERTIRAGRGPEEKERKPRKRDGNVDAEQALADRKQAAKAMRTKSKGAKKADLMKELLMVEEMADGHLERQMDAEVEGMGDDVGHSGSSNKR